MHLTNRLLCQLRDFFLRPIQDGRGENKTNLMNIFPTEIAHLKFKGNFKKTVKFSKNVMIYGNKKRQIEYKPSIILKK